MNASAQPVRVRQRPLVGPPAQWSFPELVEEVLPNGMRLLMVDLPGQHVLSLRVALRAPVSMEDAGTEGSTLLMVRSLDEGTASHTADELAELTERHGIALGAGAGERRAHLGVEVTARHLGAALDLLTECLTEPSFPEVEVARMVRHRITDIAHDLADPGARAGHEFLRRYFDDRDRTHLPVGGTRQTVARVTPDVLRRRHRALTPSGGAVVLAGDLSGVRDPVAVISASLGSWQTDAPEPGSASASRRAPDAHGIVLVPRPGLAQTELTLGRPGPDHQTPYGWGTYQVLALLLGGSPQARLDAVLREARGYTYGVRLGFRARAVGGQCMAGGAIRADATVAALEEMIAILDVPGTELTEREVREAADYTAMTAPARYLTADAVADELVSLLSDELGTDAVTRTLAQVRELTQDRAAQAWDAVRQGPGWTIVAVGDPGHREGLERLGVGPVQVADAAAD